MRSTSLVLLLLLTCCAQLQPKLVEVKVPVTTPCIVPQIEEPKWPVKSLTPDLSIYEKVQTILIELEMRKYYEEQMSSVIKSCQ